MLHRIVVDGYGDPESLLGLADKAGIDPSYLNLTGSPDSRVRDCLYNASASGLLGQVVDVILADPTVGTLGIQLRQLKGGLRIAAQAFIAKSTQRRLLQRAFDQEFVD